jgi:hypothetical protein
MNTTNSTTIPNPVGQSRSTAMGSQDADKKRDRMMSHDTLKKLCVLTVGGGLAFWATTIAFSLLPIAAEFRSLFSISYGEGVLVGPLVGGIALSFVISGVLLRFFNKLPMSDPVLKSMMLSCVAFGAAIVMVRLAATGIERDSARAFFIGTALNVPRFLALGMAIGYLHKRPYGSDVVQA